MSDGTSRYVSVIVWCAFITLMISMLPQSHSSLSKISMPPQHPVLWDLKCNSDQLELVSAIPARSVVLAVFDKNYLADAARTAEWLHGLGLLFVGVCLSADCVAEFWTRCTACSSGVVLHCLSYVVPVEAGVNPSKRCQGWRTIQYAKVFALADVIHLGKMLSRWIWTTASQIRRF